MIPEATPMRADTPSDGLARLALRAFGLPQASFTPLRQSENAVYRVDVPDGSGAALRLHTASRHTEAALRSELGWLDTLRRAGLPVPSPRRSSSGALVVRVEMADSPGTLCSLLDWLPGEPLPQGTAFNGPQAAQVGVLLARLHLQAEQTAFPPGFERPEYTVGHFGACGQELAHNLAADWPADRLALIARRVRQTVTTLEPFTALPGGHGLIHGDVHPGNVLQQPGGLALLDFDRCGWGPFLLDIALADLDLGTPERAALLAGYTAVRPLPPDSADAMGRLRVLAAVENLAFLSRQPHERPFVLEALPVVESMLTSLERA